MFSQNVIIELNGIEYEIPVEPMDLEEDKYKLAKYIVSKKPKNDEEFSLILMHGKVLVSSNRNECSYNTNLMDSINV